MADSLAAYSNLREDVFRGPSGAHYRLQELGAHPSELVFYKLHPHLLEALGNLADVALKGDKMASLGRTLGRLLADDEVRGLLFQLLSTTMIQEGDEPERCALVEDMLQVPKEDLHTLVMRALDVNYRKVFLADLGEILGGVQGLASNFPPALKKSASDALGWSPTEAEQVWDFMTSVTAMGSQTRS
ncbi:MAG: hypothetical protein AAFU79_17655 [Myxococcota bacterium]